eukprot:8398468-Pyramimonas_sp.AAC.1
MVHPISNWPSPSEDHAPVLYDEEGQEVEWSQFNSEGLYQAGDGSCIPHTISELSRAAYYWVFFDELGRQKYIARGAVWPSPPQTSQAAEQLQLALLPTFVPQLSRECY